MEGMEKQRECIEKKGERDWITKKKKRETELRIE